MNPRKFFILQLSLIYSKAVQHLNDYESVSSRKYNLRLLFCIRLFLNRKSLVSYTLLSYKLQIKILHTSLYLLHLKTLHTSLYLLHRHLCMSLNILLFNAVIKSPHETSNVIIVGMPMMEKPM